ncbi:N-acetylmuramoyl-L-alanine amidase [Bacteroides sp. 224]|uniref:N-acetylmuramoyl-L-alanine amidase family protein n=1 Tax=Bacteroides sp. 224 TaxID=2302936 RepID=UPI0013D19C3E|nr:N-acetylmuramoyl-L-alanine amidase [Bacteroides sp. 224]NDV64800.1 N-acetylmuramoyl-L-alanine amidase [Bacteroides sp. 224]
MILRFTFTVIFSFIISCITTVAQELDSPKNGEGVHSFLQRNKRTEQKHYQQFLKLNRGKFGKNNSLLLGVKYKLPPLNSTPVPPPTTTKSKRKEPLFGKKWEEYTIQSNKLAGACFYLVCGHGGPDCGAIGKVGNFKLHEDEYAYDITLRLARNLLMEGATVHIIIQDAKDGIRDDKYLENNKSETCMGDPIPKEQFPRLKQRCDKINSISSKTKSSYQRAVFIHLDSRKKSQQVDAYFYYSTGNAQSKRLANTLRNNIESRYKIHQPNRGFSGTISPRNLYVLKNTTPVCVLAELGNIRNSADQKRFIISDNRQALANWLCEGLIKDYENNKKKK